MSSQTTNVRVQRPSVRGMTVQEERKCLAEIRGQGPNISTHYILENGMYAGEFGLKYVLGQHAKRQEKNNNNSNNNSNNNNSNGNNSNGTTENTIVMGPYEEDPLKHTVSQVTFPISRNTRLHKGQLTHEESELALIHSRRP